MIQGRIVLSNTPGLYRRRSILTLNDVGVPDAENRQNLSTHEGENAPILDELGTFRAVWP